jgi:hypothetical protein
MTERERRAAMGMGDNLEFGAELRESSPEHFERNKRALEEAEGLKFAPPGGGLEKKGLENSDRNKRELKTGNMEFSMGLDESSWEHFQRNKRALEEAEGLKFAPPGGGLEKRGEENSDREKREA